MRRFDRQVAVISGGAAGIGFATARRLGREGARVVLFDRSADDLARAAGLLRGEEVEFCCCEGDTAREDDCRVAVGAALERWDRLDVAVANAAIRHYGSAIAASDEDWDRVLAVNLKGAAHLCAAAAEAMRACRGRGAIVLVSSTHALVARADMPLYDAAKAGLLSLARSLAVELARDGIRVNCVCPGFTVTDFHLRRAAELGRNPDDLWTAASGLFGRPADPTEIAAAIAFLASGDASYITATTLMVDGGCHAV